MKQKLHIFLQHLVPHHFLSRLVGKIADCRWIWLKNLFIQKFIKAYQVDMSSAIQSDPAKYENFNAFFTRALKPEARPIVMGINEVACPVDGFVSQAGMIQEGKIFQAKKFDYSCAELLGGSEELAAQFQNGNFATLYLAPKNYHRIHMPLAGTLEQMIYVPGELFSVNNNTAENVPNLFARNERVVTVFASEAGPMAVILVGAMIVASIETVWAGTIAPSRSKQIQRWDYPAGRVVLNRGAELGLFKLGSTAIVLFGPNRVTWAPEIAPGKPVEMGKLMGYKETRN